MLKSNLRAQRSPASPLAAWHRQPATPTLFRDVWRSHWPRDRPSCVGAIGGDRVGVIPFELAAIVSIANFLALWAVGRVTELAGLSILAPNQALA